MIGCLPTQALAFLAVFVYATHATQAIAFDWKPGFIVQPTDGQMDERTDGRPAYRPICYVLQHS